MSLKLKSYWSGKSAKECSNYSVLHVLGYLFPFSGIKIRRGKESRILREEGKTKLVKIRD